MTARTMLMGCAVLGALATSGCWRIATTETKYPKGATTERDPRWREIARAHGSGWGHYTPGLCERAAQEAIDEAQAQAVAKAGPSAQLADVRWGPYLSRAPECSFGFAVYYWGATADVSAAVVVADEQTQVQQSQTVPAAAAK